MTPKLYSSSSQLRVYLTHKQIPISIIQVFQYLPLIEHSLIVKLGGLEYFSLAMSQVNIQWLNILLSLRD